MGMAFWIKRLVLALVGAGLVLFVVELLKGHEVVQAIQFAAFGGAIVAMLFTLIGYIRYRRNPACMLPADKHK